MLFLHELDEAAFGKDGVFERETGEFDLLRVAGGIEYVQHPVVERAVIFEFEGTEAVGDAFEHVREAVGVVVHGIDFPRITGVEVRGVADAVDDRVAHVDVGRGHVDFGAQDVAAIRVFAVHHFLKEGAVFFDAAFTVGAVAAGFGQGAAIFADCFGVLAVHIGEAFVDKLEGVVQQLREVVAGVVQMFPVKTEPVHVALDARHVFFVFFFGVGVVVAQVAIAAEALRHVEVEADGFDVAEVQVAVGLRGKAGDDAAVVFAVFQVFFDDIFDEVGGFRSLAHDVLVRCCLGSP